MYLARDKNNILGLYKDKPIRDDTYFKCANINEIFMLDINDLPYPSIEINPALFPEVTWENSPVELVLKFD